MSLSVESIVAIIGLALAFPCTVLAVLQWMQYNRGTRSWPQAVESKGSNDWVGPYPFRARRQHTDLESQTTLHDYAFQQLTSPAPAYIR
ncbi:hypothetical protein PG987_016604 [Apiospora arundinis]